MDKTNSTMESNEGDLARGPRYERNRKYYLKNTLHHYDQHCYIT